MTDSRIWVLGAPDPEMAAIERTLRECGETVVYATTGDGERVTPATAYRCPVPEAPEGATVYAVECIDVLPDGWVRIDHHRPGDPGYGRPPSEFLAASSIGQVIAELALAHALLRLDWAPCYHRQPYGWQSQAPQFEPYYGCGHTRGRLGWVGSPARWAVGYPAAHTDAIYIPAEIVLIAAADHCLGAAYRGECPGVDPDALMRWRAESRAKFQGRDVSDVLADVERARESLRRAPTVVLDGVSPRRKREEGCPAEASRAFCVRDMRGVCTAHRLDHDCGCATQQCVTLCGAYAHGPCSVPELPDAASRDGEAYLATVTDGAGRSKIVLGGATTPEMVRAFLDHWAPSQGLVDAYGDPQRGFAGAYLTTEAP